MDGSTKVKQRLAKRFITRGNARFDEHLQFPIAGAFRVVILGGGEGKADFAKRAFGAQTQIDAIAQPGGGIRGKQIGEAVGHLLEKFSVGNFCGPAVSPLPP